jgi:hypothetical protein
MPGFLNVWGPPDHTLYVRVDPSKRTLNAPHKVTHFSAICWSQLYSMAAISEKFKAAGEQVYVSSEE